MGMLLMEFISLVLPRLICKKITFYLVFVLKHSLLKNVEKEGILPEKLLSLQAHQSRGRLFSRQWPQTRKKNELTLCRVFNPDICLVDPEYCIYGSIPDSQSFH
jgi:hypothetical protein